VAAAAAPRPAWGLGVGAAATAGVALAARRRGRHRAVPRQQAGAVVALAKGGENLGEPEDDVEDRAARALELREAEMDMRQVEMREQAANVARAGVNARNPSQRGLPLWAGINDPLEDFGGLPIPSRLKDALLERGILRASGIQKAVMPKAREGESLVIHAPTGGGKTLSFLLPMLARLQPTMHIGMQCLILVPTPELALQITRELKWLFEVLCGQERACWFNPQVPRELACEVLLSRSGLWDSIRQDTAVLVTTPGLILSELIALQWQSKKFMETLGYFFGSNLNTLVLDECDSLFPAMPPGKNPRDMKGKYGPAERVIDFIFTVVRERYRNRPVQIVCASATANSSKVRTSLRRILQKKWTKRRDAARRKDPTLVQYGARINEEIAVARGASDVNGLGRNDDSWHIAVPETITHALATVPEEDDGDRFQSQRIALVSDIVKTLTGNVLIFVPEEMKLDAMLLSLKQSGVDATKFRSEVGLSLDMDKRAKDYQTRVPKKKGAQPEKVDSMQAEKALRRGEELAESLASGKQRVLVCKMDNGRGVDLEDVEYVVLASLPKKAGDYLHLAGRTGRMGRDGTCIVCATPMEQDVTRRIENRLRIKFRMWGDESEAVPEALPEAAKELNGKEVAAAEGDADQGAQQEPEEEEEEEIREDAIL